MHHINTPKFSIQGQELIKMYEKMTEQGYDRTDQQKVDIAFSDFELRAYKAEISTLFNEFDVASVLDYGCGGSDWQASGFDEASNQSAMEYFNLQDIYRYEPARNIDDRQHVDCVIAFDVLEHLFIFDIPLVLQEIFSYASKLVILNVACYPARALLPNGENAHTTVRNPAWWKGMVDCISIEYPATSIFLICSVEWIKSHSFPVWKANTWRESDCFVVPESVTHPIQITESNGI